MARYRRKKRSGSRSKKLPLGIGAALAMDAYLIGEPLVKGDFDRFQRQAKYYAMGIQQDGTGFQLAGPMIFYGAPILAGVMHSVAGKKVNRYIPKWVPFSL